MTKAERWAGWSYFAVQVLVLADIMFLLNSLLPRPLGVMQVNIVIFCLNFVVIWGIFHRFLWNSLKYATKHLGKTLWSVFLAFCVYYVSNIAVSNLILWLAPGYANANDGAIMSMASENYPLVMLGVVVLVPVVEETLYRGLLFGRLYAKNKILGYAVSVVVFSAVHIVGYLSSYTPLELALSFLQYVPAGLTLAWAYTQADTIWAPVLMHMTINLISVIVLR